MTPFVHDYLVSAVSNNAQVFHYLLRDLDINDSRWDSRVDPERFTLREIVAHLVDYDSVCRERFEHIIREEKPELPDWDPSEPATHYEARNPIHGLESLLESRQMLSVWLKGLSQKEWKRTGSRPRVGEFSVEEGSALILAHDAYHAEQIVTWLKATQ